MAAETTDGWSGPEYSNLLVTVPVAERLLRPGIKLGGIAGGNGGCDGVGAVAARYCLVRTLPDH